MRSILSDETKFKRINKDTTSDLKSKLNNLIECTNAEGGGFKFQKITGEYKPGYAYGNVKTHKNNCPLRPIISQIPTPNYKIAKTLNKIITPYIPAVHCLKSSQDFFDLISNKTPNGIIASLDVESLFTNVPVLDTIDLITENIYNHPTLPPLKIPRNILKNMLISCTTEVPFRGPDGNLYVQTDGVAMGSPLGVLFANFYMCVLENKILEPLATKPTIYGRYIDDIFLEVKDAAHLTEIKMHFESNSCLKFTSEIGINGKLPYLDININAEGNTFTTSVYRKTTNNGRCLNAKSECPLRYKISVIDSYINRALTHCSSWDLIHNELEMSSQILINNGFSNAAVQDRIKRKLNNFMDNQQKLRSENNGNLHKLFYRNQMNHSYRTDERVIQGIVERNIKCVNPEDRLKFIIYYKNRKTSNLCIINNCHRETSNLQKANVVYQFNCNIGDCALQKTSYIGMTTTSLSRRLTMHLQEGSPKQHLIEEHNVVLDRKYIVENTKILAMVNDRRRLPVMEAILIKELKPVLNTQTVTPLFRTL